MKDSRRRLVGMNSIIDRIRRHLADPSSNHRRVVISFLWVGLFALSSRLAGAAKEMAIAWRYGVSETVDAYVFIFNLASWPVTVWFSILTVVIVPLAARVRRSQPEVLFRFQQELLGLTLLLGIGLGVIFWWGLPALLHSGLAGLTGLELQAALKMATPLTTLLPIGLLVGLYSTWLMANGMHRNTLFEAVPALTILLVLLMPLDTMPEALVWGTVAGISLQLVAVGWPLRGTHLPLGPLFSMKSNAWLDFRYAFGLMAIGQVLMSFTTLIDQFFAAHLASGALSVLNYSNRILALVLSMLAISIARAVLPVLADARAKRLVNADLFGLRWAIWIFGLGTITAIVLWICAPWIVAIIFERGAFSRTNTAEVAELLRYATFQIPFFGFSVALAQVLTSDQRWGILLISGVVGVTVKFIAASILIPSYDVRGLALSNTFVYLANSLLFLFAIKLRAGK